MVGRVRDGNLITSGNIQHMIVAKRPTMSTSQSYLIKTPEDVRATSNTSVETLLFPGKLLYHYAQPNSDVAWESSCNMRDEKPLYRAERSVSEKTRTGLLADGCSTDRNLAVPLWKGRTCEAV